MSGWHWMTLVIVIVVAYWAGQSAPNLLGGYPAKLFA